MQVSVKLKRGISATGGGFFYEPVWEDDLSGWEMQSPRIEFHGMPSADYPEFLQLTLEAVPE